MYLVFMLITTDKAQEHLNETKKLYEDLNRELMTELPELYEALV